jgi:hypothetical protein
MKKKNVIVVSKPIAIPPQANYDYKTPSHKQWYQESIERQLKRTPIKDAVSSFFAGWAASALFWKYFPTSL